MLENGLSAPGCLVARKASPRNFHRYRRRHRRALISPSVPDKHRSQHAQPPRKLKLSPCATPKCAPACPQETKMQTLNKMVSTHHLIPKLDCECNEHTSHARPDRHSSAQVSRGTPARSLMTSL